MICPNCRGRLTVLDTRPNYQDKPEVYRRLYCKVCGEWYFSEEKIRSITDKEFSRKWEKSDRWLMRKRRTIEKYTKDASDVVES